MNRERSHALFRSPPASDHVAVASPGPRIAASRWPTVAFPKARRGTRPGSAQFRRDLALSLTRAHYSIRVSSRISTRPLSRNTIVSPPRRKSTPPSGSAKAPSFDRPASNNMRAKDQTRPALGAGSLAWRKPHLPIGGCPKEREQWDAGKSPSLRPPGFSRRPGRWSALL